ncbi:unnamed protein product [Caenorhabditis auriculariae]|uniref:ACB domain-containing protein n=1 Tax=Caenorhabditis auriculariae TaxID=2777116 RepID=A0A8S1GYE8_9PELO|nr:unnamed protein product [Caenorhabditis auriculariae]
MDFDSKKKEEAHKQRIRWEQWKREQAEAEHRGLEFKSYWERRHEEDRELWRRKDFANAVDKVSRGGYKGKHGNYDIPEGARSELFALFMQVTVGDYDGNVSLSCCELWKKLRGTPRSDATREFVKLTNKVLTKYGWNPPPGWV